MIGSTRSINSTGNSVSTTAYSLPAYGRQACRLGRPARRTTTQRSDNNCTGLETQALQGTAAN